MFIGNVCLTSEKTSIDTRREVSIDILDDHHDPVIVDIDINVAR